MGIPSPGSWLLQNQLLKSQVSLWEDGMKAAVFSHEWTLSCDGCNNEKRQHLVTFLPNLQGKTYPFDVIDSTAGYRGSAEALQQIEILLFKL